MSSYNWSPLVGSGNGATIYPNFAAFPSAAGLEAGSLAVAADTGYLYVVNGGAWEAIAAPDDILFLGAVGSSPNGNAGTVTGNTLVLQPASGSFPGIVSTGVQQFSGDKNFIGDISAANLSGTNTGNVTLSAVGSSPNANAASLTGQVLSLQPFSSSFPGVVPASGGGTTNFLRADGTWAVAGSGTVTSVDMTVPAFLSVSGNPITTSGTLAITLSGTALPVTNGGTGSTTLTSKAVLLGNGTSAIAGVVGTDGTVLTGNTGANPSFEFNPRLGATGFNTGSLRLVGATSGTTSVTVDPAAGLYSFILPTTAGTAGQVLTSQGGSSPMTWTTVGGGGSVTSVDMTVPAFLSVSGNPITTSGTLAVTLSGTALPIANGGTGGTTATAAFDNLSPMNTQGDIIYRDGAGNAVRLGIGSTSNVLRVVGGVPNWGTVNLASANAVSGNLTVANGGTGNSTHTIHGVLLGQGTSVISSLVGPEGTVLTGQGASADPSFLSTVALGKAGTSQGSLSLSGSTSGTVSMLVQNAAGTYNFNLPTTAGTSGQPLLSGGGGATAMSFGTLGIGAGGTGQTTASAAFNALSPLTTKGDTLIYSTTNDRQAVPGDYGMLVPDTNQTNGWRSSDYKSFMNGKPGKNYVQYADFETGVTTGWSLGTVGTLTNGLPTGTPTFGSGASGNLSISVVSSGQLAGTKSLSLASSAATTSGNMLATASLPIDIADQAKVLQVKFSYSAISGSTNCNFSGTSSNSFAWALYDVTNSSWLTSAGNFNFVQSSGVGTVLGTCQTNSNTANIRLVVYFPNATAGAATIYLDDFYVGPQIAPSGPVVGDWTSFTPTGSVSASGGTNTVTYTGFYRRDGDSLDMQVNIAFSGSGGSFNFASSQTTINLPSGLVIDNTKLIANGNDFSYGSGSVYPGSGGVVYSVTPGQNNTTSLFIGYLNSTPGQNNTVNATAPGTFVAGGFIKVKAKVPISGWSSNSLMSSDTDTRVVAWQGYTNSTQTITSTISQITGFSTISDTHGAFASNTYTVPVSGYYQINGNLLVTGGTANNFYALIYKNGSQIITGNRIVVNGTFATSATVNEAFLFKAGDTITIHAQSSGSNNLSGGSSTSDQIWSIYRLSGPAVIAASESVAALYTASTPTGTLSGSFNKATFGTKVQDTHNAYSSGTYTTPVSGSYSIQAQTLQNATYSAGNVAITTIYVNGARAYDGTCVGFTSAGALTPSTNVHGVKLRAGDTVEVYTLNQASSPSFGANSAQNYFSIVRTGN